MGLNSFLSVSKYLKDLSTAVGEMTTRYLVRNDKARSFAEGLEALVQSAAAASLASQIQKRVYSNNARPAFNLFSAMEDHAGVTDAWTSPEMIQSSMEDHAGVTDAWSSPEMIQSSEPYAFNDASHDLFMPSCNIDGSAMFGDTDSFGHVYGQTDF